jgi:hypothetical protein
MGARLLRMKGRQFSWIPAIGQVDESETDGYGIAHQQIRMISQSKGLLAVASSVLLRAITTSQPNRRRIQRGLRRASRMATTVSVRAWVS